LLHDADRGGVIGAEPSMLKLLGSQLVQDMDILALEAIGYYAMPIDSTLRGEDADAIGPDYCDMLASGLFHHRGFTIAGGSSEVQHNIIAKGVLGL
jgi:acyl-CoA dehydrogenase